MFLALLAYFSVFNVSMKSLSAGLTQATISVWELPPRLSCRSLVSLLSLYGTWDTFLFSSPSAEITLPSASWNVRQVLGGVSRDLRLRVTWPQDIHTISKIYGFMSYWVSISTRSDCFEELKHIPPRIMTCYNTLTNPPLIEIPSLALSPVCLLYTLTLPTIYSV